MSGRPVEGRGEMTTLDYATRIVLERLRELETIQASGAQISGRPARGLVLPPPDEDSDIAGRIAMYRAWLARHGREGA